MEAYCDTAARWLAPQGRFYFVFQTTWDARVQAAIAAAGLHLYARADATMREGRPDPFLTVYEVGLSPSDAPIELVALTIRSEAGPFTPEYIAARRELGVE